MSKADIGPHPHWAYSRAGETYIKYIMPSMTDRHSNGEKQDLMKMNIEGAYPGENVEADWIRILMMS